MLQNITTYRRQLTWGLKLKLLIEKVNIYTTNIIIKNKNTEINSIAIKVIDKLINTQEIWLSYL